MSNTIYLYLKTHNKTGLKYLGKTINDPFKYKGSGKRWLNHIKKHGYDVTTEILFKSTDEERIKEKGIYYSNLWSIIESNEFANLKIEDGNDGYSSSLFLKEKLRNDKDFRHNYIEKSKQGAMITNQSDNALKYKLIGLNSIREKYPKSAFYGKKHSDETRKRMSNIAKERLSDPTKNSQYGTRWIYSLEEKKSIRISKSDPLPKGWTEGRKIKFD